MDVKETKATGGSLQISTDVIAKIAQLATMEIDGVKEVSVGTLGMRGMFKKVAMPKPIEVELLEGIAEITVNIIAKYGDKIQPLCAKIQENVKSAVQNMTSITVSRVNIVVAGVERDSTPETEEE
ncbi:MAG: Asp23/Gls24 family envelope stress response protein [Ruthenibacterium sp.]